MAGYDLRVPDADEVAMAKLLKWQRALIKKSCTRKRAYATERAVITAALAANAKWATKHLYYLCSICENYHITTKKQHGPNPSMDPS